MRSDRVVKLVCTVFLTLAVVLGILGIAFGTVGHLRTSRLPEVTAQVTSVDYGNKIYVTYTYRDALFSDIPLDYYSSTIKLGQSLSVRVDPQNPGRVHSEFASWLAAGILGFIAVIFAVVATVLLLAAGPKDRRRKRLMEIGKQQSAVVTEIRINYYVRVNRRCPYQVLCRGVDPVTGEPREFRSHNLWQDPAAAYPVGTAVRVYVDPNRPKRYWVDVCENGGRAATRVEL